MSRKPAATRQAVQAHIHLHSLQSNLSQVRKYAPQSQVLAVIKANAYGHGLIRVARALDDADAFAVARLEEADQLRAVGITRPIVLLEGVQDTESLTIASEKNCEIVVHSEAQLRMLCNAPALENPVHVWLKLDTGMHRLGFSPQSFSDVWQRLQDCPSVAENIRLMTHLACADDPGNSATSLQLALFQRATQGIDAERSVANSAAIISCPEACSEPYFGLKHAWVRPGIMLYGVSPFADKTASKLDLKPVMTLSSQLIAVNQCKSGDAIGYGGTWVCPEDMPVGVAAVGYGDGYPRHIDNETPVLVNGKRAPIIGRVSMDMITIDLRNHPQAKEGDKVTLWGEGLPVEEIAKHANTIAYELLCQVTSRVEFVDA